MILVGKNVYFSWWFLQILQTLLRVFMDLILCLDSLDKTFKCIVLINIEIMVLFTHRFMNFCRRVVCFKLFDGGLKNDKIFKLVAVVKNVSVIDKGVSIDEINSVVGKRVLSENIFLFSMFGTQLKSTCYVISKMN